MVPFAGGAFPSTDSSPNAISLTCPPDVKPGQAPPNTRIRSGTSGLGPDRSKLDTRLRLGAGMRFVFWIGSGGHILCMGARRRGSQGLLLAKRSASCLTFCFLFQRPSMVAAIFSFCLANSLIPISPYDWQLADSNSALRGPRIPMLVREFSLTLVSRSLVLYSLRSDTVRTRERTDQTRY